MKISFSTAVAGLLLPSFGSATPVSLPAEASSGLTKRRCGFETWDSINLNNWFDAGTDAWFNQWWLTRLGGNGPDTTMVIPNNWPNNFVNLFGRMYLNGAEVYTCAKPNDQCFGDVSCDDIKCSGDWGEECIDHDKQRPVYMVLQSIQGFQSYFRDYIEVLDETQMNLQGMSAYLVSDFFPPISDSFEFFLRELLVGLGTAFSIGGSYMKLTKWVKANDITKESSSALGALLNGVGTGYREVVKYPASQSFNDFADLGVFMTNVFEQTRSALNDMQENLATGNYWGGKRFFDYAAGGVFLPGPGKEFSADPTASELTLLRQYLQKQFNARAINYIWRQQKIFITYTTDVDGSCEQDQQGPQDMKYCREGDAGVYYMYWWHEASVGAGSTTGLNNFDTGKMDHPTGWDKLAAGWVDEGYQLELKDVFESSISAYQVAKFSYDGENAVKRAQEAVTDGWANPWDQGTSWEGTFTIPVCDTGDVSYNVQVGDRIMPCGCGGGNEVDDWKKAAKFDGYTTYDDQCTEGMQAARKQARRGGQGNQESNTPALPTNVNEIACLTSDGVNKDMVTQLSYCQKAVASLGDDRDKQICSSDCQDGGVGQNSVWCRLALDDSNIHFCALTMAAKDSAHGGPGYGCMTVGNAQDFLANAEATTENGGKGCHPVGTPDFAATFLTPDGMTRWCLSDYEHAGYCTV
ncbi:hypothetical protein BGZ61DRAFT_515977 [Ilyonectria robusta]|uniref:uncharacterized protein n=1 Tax=Ilyonectria robusta TaxID=1079257 RepID=UPI001E8CBAD8|nr:uncharacterized protein BGZ61DRAFT_515977 [Ilyonectria robusta]KAH8721753.1 hypothetical protein BGZ61DRAFT_515977 [Ilyonectria robusta]